MYSKTIHLFFMEIYKCQKGSAAIGQATGKEAINHPCIAK